MSTRLSICISVHDAQSALHACVVRLLEVVSELTNDFELLIVDNGSTDATTEAAHELEIQYPQVRVITNRARLGHAAALRRALVRADGELLIYPEREGRLDATCLRTIWAKAEGNDAVFCPRRASRSKHRSAASHLFSRAARKRRASTRHRLIKLASSIRRPKRAQESKISAPILVRHEVLNRLGWIPLERGELMAAATAHGYHWCQAPEAPSSSSLRDRQVRGEPDGLPRGARQDVTPRRDLGPARPNYLDRIRRFAREE